MPHWQVQELYHSKPKPHQKAYYYRRDGVNVRFCQNFQSNRGNAGLRGVHLKCIQIRQCTISFNNATDFMFWSFLWYFLTSESIILINLRCETQQVKKIYEISKYHSLIRHAFKLQQIPLLSVHSSVIKLLHIIYHNNVDTFISDMITGIFSPGITLESS